MRRQPVMVPPTKPWGVRAVRTAGSMFGAAEVWCRDGDRFVEFETEAEARTYARETAEKIRSTNLYYYAAAFDGCWY